MKKAHTIEWLSSITSDYMHFRHIPPLPLDLFKWTRNQIILFTYFSIPLNMYQNDVESGERKCNENSVNVLQTRYFWQKALHIESR